MVRLWVANTDNDWFDFLAAQPELDEVNFWQPSGRTDFHAIFPSGALFMKFENCPLHSSALPDLRAGTKVTLRPVKQERLH